MRTALAVIYLIVFVIALLFFIAGNIIGSGMFCNGYCAFEQTAQTIMEEVGLVVLLIGTIAGFLSKRGTSVIKDLLMAVAAIPAAAVTWFFFMFLSVAMLG